MAADPIRRLFYGYRPDNKALDISTFLIKFSPMERINLLGNTVDDLEKLMLNFGEKPYRARQLFKWLYHLRQYDFSRMTNLSKSLRSDLLERFVFDGPEIEKIAASDDGTEKLLFRLADGSYIESVIIPDGDKNTVCVSTQVGCALDCAFCATGKAGFIRNLTTGEIVGQLLYIRERGGAEAFHNIVFMGMGEPLLNYKNMVAAVGIISSEIGLSVSAKRVTVSTAGIVPGIIRLADSGLKVNLAISLHAASDKKRMVLMPIAKKYRLAELMKAAEYFAVKRKKRVTFEYILFKGFNDSKVDALELARLVEGIPCKINILAYNPVNGLPYERPSDDDVDRFGKLLYPRAPAVTVRKSRGLDIAAACGQLAGKYEKS